MKKFNFDLVKWSTVNVKCVIDRILRLNKSILICQPQHHSKYYIQYKINNDCCAKENKGKLIEWLIINRTFIMHQPYHEIECIKNIIIEISAAVMT